jgi:hypothetical protein
MDVLGWITASIGAALFIASLIRTIRANPETRVPFYRNPPIIPAGSIAMRSIGAGLLIFGCLALTGTLDMWSMVLLVGVLLVTLTVITIHNRRLALTANR